MKKVDCEDLKKQDSKQQYQLQKRYKKNERRIESHRKRLELKKKIAEIWRSGKFPQEAKTVLIICFFVYFFMIIFLPILITIVGYELIYCVRTEPKGLEYELKKEDFSHINSFKKMIAGERANLACYVYGERNELTRGVVVMSHGIYNCSCMFLNQAEYFTQNGYMAVIYDNTGCHESEGDSTFGIVQAPHDLNSILNYVEGDQMFDNLPLVLLGYSWGGYAVTNVFNLEEHPRVQKVVSISGTNSSIDLVNQQGKDYLGELVNLFLPYLNLYEITKFGFSASTTSVRGIEQSDAKFLIYHSLDDSIVRLETSIYDRKDDIKTKNVEYKLFNNKNHYIMNSDASVEHINQTNKRFESLILKYWGIDSIPKNVLDEHYAQINKELYNQIDLQVMNDILSFYDKVA